MNGDEEIRGAAEALLTSITSNRQPTPQLQHSLSSQAARYATEDLVTGMRRSGQISVVRRFFCLFVTFDLLFTSLLWLIVILLNGDDIASALSKQVVHYNIHMSLFDVVMAAACRFTFLLLFYGLLYISHWWIIALTTAGTCAFLIAKVFLYNWTSANQPVFQVLLVLISFVISWGEAWFLDFRVLPQELQAMEYLQAISSYSDAERTPLLRNYLQDLLQIDDYTESVGNFYSPVDSSQSSDDEDARRSGVVGRDLSQDMKYRREGRDILEKSWRILNSPDWKLEKETANGDKVYSKEMPGEGKVLKLAGMVDFPADQLLHELFSKAENIPNWNPSILETRTIQADSTMQSASTRSKYNLPRAVATLSSFWKCVYCAVFRIFNSMPPNHKYMVVDAHTDISYQVAKEAGGGIVSSRDFVILRHWGMKDSCYVSAGISIKHPKVPPYKKYIRGENGPTCWVMRPVVGDANRCVFQWLLSVNLKGWLPNSVVQSALTTTMLDYIKYVRLHTEKLKEESQ